MSQTLERQATLQTLQVEKLLGMDDQGRPTYSPLVPILGRAVREDMVVRLPNGQEVRSTVTIWVPGTEAVLPNTDDRITLASGVIGVVVERWDGVTLGGVLDHVRVRVREE